LDPKSYRFFTLVPKVDVTMANMWLLTMIVTYQAVSARFMWLDARPSLWQFDANDNDNAFNLMEAFNLDISLPSFDAQPSSPLYLQVESVQRPDSNFVYVLDESGKVNGDTYRYSIQSDGRNQIITRTWSSSNMYLCNTRACGDGNRMEMMSVFDNLLDLDQTKQKYLHLVPSTTAQLEAAQDSEPEEANSWLNIAVGTMKGCHQRMKQMMMSSQDDSALPEDEIDGQELVLSNEVASNSETHTDLFWVATSAIMLCMVACGVVYALWRFMKQCKAEKEKDAMDAYVRLQHYEVDAF